MLEFIGDLTHGRSILGFSLPTLIHDPPKVVIEIFCCLLGSGGDLTPANSFHDGYVVHLELVVWSMTGHDFETIGD